MDENRNWATWGICILEEIPTKVFFPKENVTSDVNYAKSICNRCDVRIDCLHDSIRRNEEYGIWGGMTEPERRKYTTSLALRGRLSDVLRHKRPHVPERPAYEYLVSQEHTSGSQTRSPLVYLRVPAFGKASLVVHTESLSTQSPEMLALTNDQKPLVEISRVALRNSLLLLRLRKRLDPAA